MPMRRSDWSNSALRGPSRSRMNARASAVFPGRIGKTRQTGSIRYLQKGTPYPIAAAGSRLFAERREIPAAGARLQVPALDADVDLAPPAVRFVVRRHVPERVLRADF